MKRKQYIDWLTTVLGIFGVTYGGYLLAWHYNQGNGLNVLALVLLIVGIISLLFSIVLFTFRFIYYKKTKDAVIPTQNEEVTKDATIKEEIVVEPKPKQNPTKSKTEYTERSYPSSYSYSASSTIYVKLLGHGPLLRIEGSQILDMRNNTYYRIEGNIVKQDGYGPLFEINGNQIRNIYGGNLFELSGSNINKTLGGFYASISGNYVTLYDSSRKYEITDSLSKVQILAVAALLFN